MIEAEGKKIGKLRLEETITGDNDEKKRKPKEETEWIKKGIQVISKRDHLGSNNIKVCYKRNLNHIFTFFFFNFGNSNR